ncbi:MAG: single-stranded DNA-binding protein [Spirochaetales bacterium]|nr:single-stranded DNA-binding protein [Spirochaetales bacterium]
MNSLNSILVEGNLTRDPVLATTPKGTAVCNFSVASNRFYRSDDDLQKEVSFFDVEVWSRLAERCAEELTKGRGVRVVGRLKQDRWQDKEEKPRSRVKIVAEHVEFRRPRQTEETAEKTAGEAELEEVQHVAEGEREPAEVVF